MPTEAEPTESEADPAAGTADHPIGSGEAQPGDLAERAAQLGGPVDIAPTRRRPGLEGSRAVDPPKPG